MRVSGIRKPIDQKYSQMVLVDKPPFSLLRQVSSDEITKYPGSRQQFHQQPNSQTNFKSQGTHMLLTSISKKTNGPNDSSWCRKQHVKMFGSVQGTKYISTKNETARIKHENI